MKSSVAISGLKMTSLVVIWAGPKETLIEFLDRLSSRKKNDQIKFTYMISQSSISFLDLLLYEEVSRSCLERLQYTILPFRNNEISTCISLSSFATILISRKRSLRLIKKVYQEKFPPLSPFQTPGTKFSGSGVNPFKFLFSLFYETWYRNRKNGLSLKTKLT